MGYAPRLLDGKCLDLLLNWSQLQGSYILLWDVKQM